MAINQYIYTYIYKRAPNTSSIIQTSNLQVKINSKIRHKIIKETLNYFKIKDKIHIGFSLHCLQDQALVHLQA